MAWVVMPEHFHLLLVPTETLGGSPLSIILVATKKPLAEQVLGRWRDEGRPEAAELHGSRGRTHFWQPGGGFDRLVRDSDELDKTVRYIHNNPVARGLVEHPLDWEWSSARWYAGERHREPTIDPPFDADRQSGWW